MESYRIAGIVIIALSAFFNCLFALMIILHRRSTPRFNATLTRLPAVSVLLTMRNLDDGLEENIASVLSSEYPDFNVFVAVDSMEDLCVPVLERAIARFPGVRSTVVATGHLGSGNPKINKLARLEAMSDASLFWVLDSDTRVFPDTLSALVAQHIGSGAHIVFSPVRCSGARTFGSILEMSYVNFFLSGSMLAAWKLFRARVVVGKSLLVDAHALRHFGGFAYFADVLSEDHWLGEAFHQSGFDVQCNYTWVNNIKETTTVKNFYRRIRRWATLRFCLKTPVYLLEILFNPIGLSLLFMPVLKPLFPPLFAALVFLRLTLEYLVFFAVNENDRRNLRVILGLAPAVLMKDLIMLLVYFIPFFSRQVLWRGSRIKIAKDTRIVVKNAGPAGRLISDSKSSAVITVLMGLGHLRAAYPLLCLKLGKMLPYGSRASTPLAEYRIWRSMRRSYYFISRAEDVPVLGSLLTRAMAWMERIDPDYRLRDQSKPNFLVRFLDCLITRRGVCRDLTEKLRHVSGPIIHTYFATAIAADKAFGADAKKENYLVLCDSDFNRVWVPKDPHRSNLRYCVPCSQAKRRLIAYGVAEERIYTTGFPLPLENTGCDEDLDTLKSDVFERLQRLDPAHRFFQAHDTEVTQVLHRAPALLNRNTEPFTITFAVGGAGAQVKLACDIVTCLGDAIRKGMIRIILSAGIRKRSLVRILNQVNQLGLYDELGRNVQLIFDPDPFRYFDAFNLCLRRTDVLWTKPSELVFYAGLGIPILMAPPIGSHEELNATWLHNIRAGVEAPGPVEFCNEWLLDLRDSGRFAEAAWHGFLKARKRGAFRIKSLVQGEPAGEGGP
jgi:cellulose synthase/poly-beta-1,6-N-acetylglucosamine synthase-like glycosyltransferase